MNDAEKEIRWYKGKFKVKVLKKSRVMWRVKALEDIPKYAKTPIKKQEYLGYIAKGFDFIILPRLLWKKKRGGAE